MGSPPRLASPAMRKLLQPIAPMLVCLVALAAACGDNADDAAPMTTADVSASQFCTDVRNVAEQAKSFDLLQEEFDALEADDSNQTISATTRAQRMARIADEMRPLAEAKLAAETALPLNAPPEVSDAYGVLQATEPDSVSVDDQSARVEARAAINAYIRDRCRVAYELPGEG